MNNKLLIITQSVDENNQVLGFFCQWIKEFSKKYEKVTVICLEKGTYSFDNNVEIISLGKETGNSKVTQILKFFFYILSKKNKYDFAFVHMNQVWTILGGFFWKVLSKKIFLWYTHSSVSFSLKISKLFVNKYFSVQKNGFNLTTNKVFFTGHGINTNIFLPGDRTGNINKKVLISVSRISETKNQLLMIKLLEDLINKGKNYILEIYGSPITTKDNLYLSLIKKYIDDNSLSRYVLLKGNIKNTEVVKALNNSDIFLNFSDTGSIDKAILEAMSCNLKILTTNTAFSKILTNNGFVNSQDINILTKNILELSLNTVSLRNIILNNNSLEKLILKLKNEIK